MPTKDFRFDIKAVSDQGTFTGFASVYAAKDLQGDVVDRGAFVKTLSERGGEIPILWQHDQTSPIGLGTLTDTPQGLKIVGKLSLGTTKGREAYELMRDRVVRGLSIGYDVIKQKFADGARHLQEIKLYEISAVTFPACPDAVIGAVKASKAGRVLSATNRARILAAHDALARAQDLVASTKHDLHALHVETDPEGNTNDSRHDDEAVAKSLRALSLQLKEAIATGRAPTARSLEQIAAQILDNHRRIARRITQEQVH